MDCNKCKGPASLLLRKKDSYCNSCFVTNTNHKFRACIGKNKILSTNENVLVCLSEGVGSAVLMDLIYNGITLNNHKKLRINPYVLHLIEMTNNNVADAKKVLEMCNKYKVNVYVAHISEYIKINSTLPEMNCIPPRNNEIEAQFHAMLKSVPTTASNDLLQKIKRNLFIRFAKLLECNFIFTAETTTTLAINLLTNLALGRGSQIQNDVGFCDTRDNDIKMLRPMKDISKEELDHYINIQQLVPVCRNGQNNSLQSVIGSFVNDLQDSFPATISTVCKIADKIGIHGDNENLGNCIICESNLDADNIRLTALEATNFSRTVSERPLNDSIASASSEISERDVHKAMFPFIHKQLCYGCSRNYSEMQKSNFPNHVQKLLGANKEFEVYYDNFN